MLKSQRFIKILLAAGLVLLTVALWRRDVLPKQAELQSQMAREPEQVAVQRAPFDAVVDGVSYKVQPLYEYELYGLVVSAHDSKTWWDYIHREWNDVLNVMDVCVVWGDNARSNAYERIEFSSGQFVCYFSTGSSAVYEAFDQAALSNNHLLTADPGIARKMRAVRIGDQIHFRGHLAEYSLNKGTPFKRGTSINRTDSGNGACETVYVEDFEIMQRGGEPWRALVWIAVMMVVTAIVAWFRLPLRFDD